MTTVAPPRRRPAAAVVAPVLAAVLIGTGVVAVRDLFVSQGWTTGTTWIGSVLESLDGLTATWWVVAIGVALALVGLVLVIVALKPRRLSHQETALSGDVWIDDAAIGSLASSAAEETPGAAGATARVTRRRVSVTVQSHDPHINEQVETAVRRRLDGFTDRPVRVTIEKVKDDA